MQRILKELTRFFQSEEEESRRLGITPRSRHRGVNGSSVFRLVSREEADVVFRQEYRSEAEDEDLVFRSFVLRVFALVFIVRSFARLDPKIEGVLRLPLLLNLTLI